VNRPPAASVAFFEMIATVFQGSVLHQSGAKYSFIDCAGIVVRHFDMVERRPVVLVGASSLGSITRSKEPGTRSRSSSSCSGRLRSRCASGDQVRPLPASCPRHGRGRGVAGWMWGPRLGVATLRIRYGWDEFNAAPWWRPSFEVGKLPLSARKRQSRSRLPYLNHNGAFRDRGRL
jgi:hypothetical protein